VGPRPRGRQRAPRRPAPRPAGLLFHPAELYSYYGLKLRASSPLPHTLAVGLSGDEIGYLTDPAAYEKNEYAAIVVPKILECPPYAPEAADVLTGAALELLKKIA
jgi:neutral ceramidase